MDPESDEAGRDGDAGGERGADGDRRQFLRRVATLGTGTAAATLLASGTSRTGGEGSEEVVYAHARPSPGTTALEPRTTEVPARWLAEVRRTFAAREELAELGIPEVRLIAVAPGGFGEASTSLSVGVAQASVGERIADVLSGVDVVAEVLGERLVPDRGPDRPDPDQVVDAVGDRTVPGGVLCAAPDALGTLAPAVYDADGDPFFATSNHLYGAGGTKRRRHRGESLSVVAERARAAIGRVRRGYPNEDVVQVDPHNGYVPRPRIASPGRPTVVGQFTRIGLAVLKARGRRLRKVGAFSGHTTGEVVGVDGVTCYVGDVCKDGQLLWGEESAITDGDSGSVAYHPDPEGPDDHVLVAGFNGGRTWWPGADYVWGTAAYHLRERFGWHF